MAHVPYEVYKDKLETLIDIYQNNAQLTRDLQVSKDYINRVMKTKPGIKNKIYQNIESIYKQVQELEEDGEDAESIIGQVTKASLIATNDIAKKQKENKAKEKKLTIGKTYQVIYPTPNRYKSIVTDIKGTVVLECNKFYVIDNGKYKDTILKNDLFCENIKIKELKKYKN